MHTTTRHSIRPLGIALVPHLLLKRCAALILFAALVLALQNARAQNANWVGGNAGDPNEWVETNNWNPATVPNGIATFGSTGVTSVANDNGIVSIGTIQFTSTAQAYTFSIDNPFIISGSGVNSLSPNTQTFNITDGNSIVFQNSSSASSGAGLVVYSNSGFIYFEDTSTAGSGSFTNNEIVQLSDTSSAGSATITNNIELDFFDSTSAASATITNGGELTFNNSATSGSATITNSGTVQFLNNSTAGDATITTGSGGVVTFTGSSTGGQAQFVTDTSGTFDMSGLSSGSMTAGSIAGAGNYFLGSKTLIVGGSGLSGTVSGTISDGGISSGSGGSLVKSGTGTLALTGSNSYTGGTTLNAGTLSVGNNSALGTGTLTVNGEYVSTLESPASGVTINNPIAANGEFYVSAVGGDFTLGGAVTLGGTGTSRTIVVVENGPNVVIFSNGIAGSGGVQNLTINSIGGGGIVQFTGSTANTYTGLTDVNGYAELELNQSISNGAIGAGGLEIDFGATVQLEANDQINDSATVTLSTTSATFDLNGHNETIGALDGIGNVTLNSGTLTVGSGTFSGAIINAAIFGELVKTGPGTLVVGGTGSALGFTAVNGGLLQVDGTFGSVTTEVNAGGTLGGKGQVIDVFNNGGKVAPGDSSSPGTLTLTGDYNQSSAGTLTIRVGGAAAGQHDLLSAGGEVDLGGTLQLVRLNNFSLQSGDKIVIISAGFGVFGTFSTVETNTLLDAKVVYDPDDVALVFSSSSFVIPGLTPNQLAVARDLDTVSGDSRETALITFLENQPLGSLPHDYDLIAPEELTAIFQISEAFADVQAGNIENHLADVRGSYAPPPSNTVGLMVRDDKNAVDPKDEKGGGLSPVTNSNRWNVWSEGSGDFVRVDGDTNAAGYHFDTGGITLGADYRVCDHFVAGIMGGYADTGATLTQGGSVDVNSGRLGVYSTTFDGGFYLNTLASGGYNSYDTHRTALGGVAQGDTDGGEFDGLVGGGYDLHSGNFTFGPVASAQYTYVGLDGYNENGSLAPLHIDTQHQDSLRSKVGFKVSSVWNIGGVTVTPSITAEWEHEYLNDAYALDSQFASGAGNVFTVTGPKLGRDGAVVNAGVNVQWTERLGTYIFYYGELGRENYQQNSVTAGVKFGF